MAKSSDGVRGGVFGKSLLTGTLLAVLLAATPTVMHWIDNPGGVFRGPGGTHWAAVLETFWSWLWPGILLALAVATVLTLITRRQRGGSQSG